MSTFVRCFFIFVLVLIPLGCSSSATEEDLVRFKAVQEKWGTKYKFLLDYSSFVAVKARPGVNLDESEVSNAAKLLFQPEVKDRLSRKSGLVYLNVYNSDGKFQYQLFRNDKGGIGKGFEEYQ